MCDKHEDPDTPAMALLKRLEHGYCVKMGRADDPAFKLTCARVSSSMTEIRRAIDAGRWCQAAQIMRALPDHIRKDLETAFMLIRTFGEQGSVEAEGGETDSVFEVSTAGWDKEAMARDPLRAGEPIFHGKCPLCEEETCHAIYRVWMGPSDRLLRCLKCGGVYAEHPWTREQVGEILAKIDQNDKEHDDG